MPFLSRSKNAGRFFNILFEKGAEKMNVKKEDIKRYENKIKACNSMTDLLVAMAAWQSFADSHGLTVEEKEDVDRTYIEAEGRLITQVKPTLW